MLLGPVVNVLPPQPSIIFLVPVVTLQPADFPRKILSEPLSSLFPAKQPMNTLLPPAQLVWPALYPIATLKQVSASESVPALVPAYKFSCESGENPALIPVKY